MSNFPSPRGTAVPTHVRPCASHWARCGNSPRSLTIPNYRYFRCGDPTILNCQFVARRAAFASSERLIPRAGSEKAVSFGPRRSSKIARGIRGISATAASSARRLENRGEARGRRRDRGGIDSSRDRQNPTAAAARDSAMIQARRPGSDDE